MGPPIACVGIDLSEGRGMYGVDLYRRVRWVCHREGLSRREADRRFGIDCETVTRVLALSVPRPMTMTITRDRISALVFLALSVASFLAYGMERNIAPRAEKEKFGRGSLRGLTAPETANNAACSGSFVPLLTLGIPGSGTTAVMLGALISYGVQPGPTLFTERPAVFWSVIISMYVGNVILVILNLPLIPYIARLLMLPAQLLVPLVLFFSLCGVYLVSFNSFDIHLMVAFAACAVLLRLLGYSMAPMILGFVLGRLMEENLRRALEIYDGYSFLWERPITLGIMILTALILLAPLVQWVKARRELAQAGEGG